MKTKHRTAAKYKRAVLRAAGPEIFELTIKMAAPMDAPDVERLETALRMSVDQICHGRGTPADFNDILEAVSITRIHSEKIEDDQTRDATFAVANDGMIAMNKMRDRYLAHGKLGFTGLELRAVLDTLDLYGQFLVHCTRGQLVDALKQAEKEMRCPPQEEKEAA